MLHSHLSPFPLYRGTIQAPRQSIGTTPISKLKFNSLTSHSNTAVPPLNIQPEIHTALELYKISFHSLPPLLPPTILLFDSNLPTPASANCQLHWYLPPWLRQLEPAQNILPISFHFYAITQYLTINILYHLFPCLFTFPHSLYLIPKHFLLPSKNHSPIALPISGPPFFLQLDGQFRSHSLCSVSVIGSPICKIIIIKTF